MKNIIILLTLVSSLAQATALDYLQDGITKPIKVDTVTPANTRAYPFSYYSVLGVKTELALNSDLLLMSAKLPPVIGINLAATSLSVVLASDAVLPLPTGASTSALQTAGNLLITDTNNLITAGNLLLTAGNVSTASIDTKTPALVGGRVPVDVGTSVLPTGAATEATLAALSAKFGSLGQALMAGSAPVVIASNQSAIPVSQSGTWNLNNITGTISLPTGAATLAGQTTGNTTLGDISSYLLTINAKTPSLGAAVTAASVPVNIASDQVLNTKPSVMAAVTVKQAAITVGISAVRLTTDGSAPSATRQKLLFMLDPNSTTTNGCYLGSSGVTITGATRGLLIFPGATQEYINDANDYFLICDTAAQTIFVTEAE